jgi:hypothetical protein
MLFKHPVFLLYVKVNFASQVNGEFLKLTSETNSLLTIHFFHIINVYQNLRTE